MFAYYPRAGDCCGRPGNVAPMPGSGGALLWRPGALVGWCGLLRKYYAFTSPEALSPREGGGPQGRGASCGPQAARIRRRIDFGPGGSEGPMEGPESILRRTPNRTAPAPGSPPFLSEHSERTTARGRGGGARQGGKGGRPGEGEGREAQTSLFYAAGAAKQQAKEADGHPAGGQFMGPAGWVPIGFLPAGGETRARQQRGQEKGIYALFGWGAQVQTARVSLSSQHYSPMGLCIVQAHRARKPRTAHGLP